jgi:hypothetical protein
MTTTHMDSTEQTENRPLHTQEVTGSSPVAPTIESIV